MADTKWLEKYYGKDFDLLNPEMVFDGKKKAVVRLTRTGTRGFSGIGYVLIDKNGSHSASPFQSLFEGVPSRIDMDKMKETLTKEDA